MDEMFKYEFRHLATLENGRTPVLLTEEQYRRAQACVNACAGMTDEQVSHGLVSASVLSSVVDQRDALLIAIEQFLDPEGNPPEDTGEWREVLRLIASMKGGAQ